MADPVLGLKVGLQNFDKVQRDHTLYPPPIVLLESLEPILASDPILYKAEANLVEVTAAGLLKHPRMLLGTRTVPTFPIPDGHLDGTFRSFFYFPDLSLGPVDVSKRYQLRIRLLMNDINTGLYTYTDPFFFQVSAVPTRTLSNKTAAKSSFARDKAN